MGFVTIDTRRVEITPGETLLAAARRLGVEIPTLCFLEGLPPLTSCMLCVVKDTATGRTFPSCSTMAEDGMEITTRDDEIVALRRGILELFLSEHVGDCEAPCRLTCPASTDVPLMNRLIATGQFAEAAAEVSRDLILPATLGYICPAPCQSTCRRRPHEEPVQVKELHRQLGERALAAADAEPPALCSNKRVAVVGGGPAGLAAAAVLRRRGHACRIFEKAGRAGGALREIPDDELPQEILDGEIELLEKLGIEIVTNHEVSGLVELTNEHDAVIVSCGGEWDLGPTTFFAKGHQLAVRAVANGRAAAEQVDQLLRGLPTALPAKLFQSRIGKLSQDEVELLAAVSRSEDRAGKNGGDGPAKEQAEQCLQCGCLREESCKLRRYATEYGAAARKFKATQRRRIEFIGTGGEVVLEPGKCIKCGLCVIVATQAGERLGLAFAERGYDMCVRVPFNGSLTEAVAKSAAECAAVCPTGALAQRRREQRP